MNDPFRLLMISAMYENGGNTTHRFLDGHPQLFVYPFESQLGTRLVQDALSSTFPLKYRWPEFALSAEPADDFRAIIDEEMRVRIRTPNVSKFRDWPMELSDDDRQRIFVERVGTRGRSRGGNVAAFFEATFEAWKDLRRSGQEQVYVGYSPIVAVDGEKMLADLPGLHLLHVVRNPWAAYADTKKRAVPLGVAHYMLGWSLSQYYALMLAEKHPGRVHIVRLEDELEDPRAGLRTVCEALGIEVADTLTQPTWNGQSLDQVYPWGTIRTPTHAANRATAEELSAAERDEVRRRAGPYLQILGYEKFW